jgi:hypothetical protein
VKRIVIVIIGLGAVQRPLAGWSNLEQGWDARAEQEKT